MSTPPSDLPCSTPSSLPSHRQSSSSTQPFIALTKPEKAQLLRIIKVHLKVFLASLGLLQALEVGKAGLRSARSKGAASKQTKQTISDLFQLLLKPLKSNVRTALFLSLYPALFRLFNLIRLRSSSRTSFLRDPLHSRSSSRSTTGEDDDTNRRKRYPGILRSARINIETPTLLLAPLCLLLPLGWLSQLNLYSTTAAGLAGSKYLSGRIEKGEMTWDGLVRKLGLGVGEVEEVVMDEDEREEGDEKGYRPYWMPRTPKCSMDGLDSIGSASKGHIPTPSAAMTKPRPESSHKDVLVRIRDALSGGGSWWLFSLSQGWLLYTAVFEGDCFPSSYRKGIISRSRRYVPTTQSLNLPPSQASLIPHPSSILSLLPVFAHSPYPHPPFPLPQLPGIKDQYASFLTLFDVAHVDHTKAICSVLHPLEPSCTRNYLKAVGDALPSAVVLIGGWSGLTTLLRWKKFSRNPAAAFVKWIKATARGAAMIALSISTAWVWVCAFQRILKPTTLPRARFALGGILAGCWIVLVPSSRRLELGMYTFRLSLASLWKVGLKKGWWKYRSSMRFLPFALAMTLLTYIKRRDTRSIDGWVGRTVKYLDQEVELVKKEEQADGQVR